MAAYAPKQAGIQSNPDAESSLKCTKELFKEPNRPRRIKSLTFGVMSPAEVASAAALQVHAPQLYTRLPERAPQQDGVLDRRLGVSNKRGPPCQTCEGRFEACVGHFGYIRLELPVFHIGYFKATHETLQSICKSCARVLLEDAVRQKFLRRARRPGLDRLQRAALYKQVIEKCKKVRACPWCGEPNGPVKKTPGFLKLVHLKYGDKVDARKEHEGLAERRAKFHDVLQANQEFAPHLRTAPELLDPLKALELFSRVPQSDCRLLCLAGRPENLLLSNVAVPPVSIRPSVEMEGGAGSNEDDITVKLSQVATLNAELRDLIRGNKIGSIMERWDLLQIECALIINADLPGFSSIYSTDKVKRGFVQRLKGKQGRFRGNLSGKRADFTGRTVISPDPNVGIDQVVVPMHMATTLTYPERVTTQNIERLRALVVNGPEKHPGARFVIHPGEGTAYLAYGDRRQVASRLKVGDIVERHLQDGDVILFNRQPSLHRVSIMAFRARVQNFRTLRFNECVCAPFNADFDGDEMNIHVPQTEEARAEAIVLMGVLHNLAVPKNGDLLVGATQDFLTAAFLLTRKELFLTRAEFMQLCAYLGDASEPVDVPAPALIKPVELWTGKQVISVLLRPSARARVFVTCETMEKVYVRGRGPLCPNEGFVLVRNSELLCGRLGKMTLGGGNKNGLFAVLNNDYSPQVAAMCMSRLAKLSARLMGDIGFSIGIGDVMPSPEVAREREAILAAGYAKCDEYIGGFHKGSLPLVAGCDLDQSLETHVMGVLNSLRDEGGRFCMNNLGANNSPLIMSQCGSKGSPSNIAQMVVMVGQQAVNGKRAPDGFSQRSLPHFPRGCRTPGGKGFVANSFYSGLTPTEFFFHTMAGREGLVDTAVKTAETGYMSRRLMKALEDLYVHYDGTVRSAHRTIVQFTYGDDGLDPVYMEGADGEPVDLPRVMARARALVPLPDDACSMMPDELEAAVKAGLARWSLREDDVLRARVRQQLGEDGGEPGDGREAGAVWASRAQKPLDEASRKFLEERDFSLSFTDSVSDFLRKEVDRLVEAREGLGLPVKGSKRGDAKLENLVSRIVPINEAIMDRFLAEAVRKYRVKEADPGSTVGAYGAQSIGEPGTQMTLKTFHFAGVASMNVTLGVPRIKEVINAARKISTPIIEAHLAVNDQESAARAVQSRLERTLLGQVARTMRVIAGTNDAHLLIELCEVTVARLRLSVSSLTVRAAILASKLKLKPEMVRIVGPMALHVYPGDTSTGDKAGESDGVLVSKHLNDLKTALPQIIVAGIPTIARAVIHRENGADGRPRFKLLAEGTDLSSVMSTVGVMGQRSTTNHVTETEEVLGIEAARRKIIEQIEHVMGAYGMAVDSRHVALLADCMTARGSVLGITRFGIAKMKESVLMLASFEKTTDHLFDAALHGLTDQVDGVSEAIIMGIPMPTGTGLFKLVQNQEAAAREGRVATDKDRLAEPWPKRPPLLLSY
ncbi:unnamed protein product [Pedinophyceae sp. YPF-701]|nr:unnamed protein product [Pedinophyceae sp. YPF-701]